MLCFRTVWEASYGELIRRGRITQEAGRRVTGWQKPFGAISAAHTLAQNAQRHFHRYGTSRETLGWIALNQRANAALNPTAIYRDPMTMDDYLSARTVTTPSGCTTATCPATDRWPSSCRPWTPRGTSPSLPSWWRPSAPRSWSGSNGNRAPHPRTTGARPGRPPVDAHVTASSDVDVAQLYDGFTFNCLSWIEGLGFCGIGEAKDFLDGGKNIARDGLLPLNTHGGQLSHGRTHGLGLVHEAVTQVRGEAGARQVDGARVAVTSTGGLTPSGVILLRADT